MGAPQNHQFELVLAVDGYWDQPRAGMALVRGVPHRFYCPFDEQLDDYAEQYRLHPLDAATLRLECEAFEIYNGHGLCPDLPQVLPDPIPRFPEAEARFNELQRTLQPDRDLVDSSNHLALAEFKRRAAPDSWRGTQLWSVRWTLLAAPTP